MQEALFGRSALGFRVYDDPEPLRPNGWSEPPHTRPKASVSTTDSENVTVRSDEAATPLAPSAGVVAVTLGASSPGLHASPQPVGVGCRR